jgi:putative flavoprotein involved in K+ transport
VVQLHSVDYRNPAQLPPGTVLVVGAANSGAGIAEELSATHQVVLSKGGRLPHLPRRLLGKPLHFWGERLGLIAAPLDSWRGRTQRSELLVGPSLNHLARRCGIRLTARTIAADGRSVRFSDGTQLDVEAVVWATGYRPGYARWLDAPIFQPGGTVGHRRGVTDVPGLYLLGMKNQHSRGSALIHWVRHDAAYIVDHLARPRQRHRRVEQRPARLRLPASP